MSTRAETPTDEEISPYAPRWVRDPSYQVLRQAETLKRTIRNPGESEPAPSVPCEEPDMPHDFPQFIKRNEQVEPDDLYIENIRVPAALRPRRSLDRDRGQGVWPRRRGRRQWRPNLVQVALAVSAAAGASYLLVWSRPATQEAGTPTKTVLASAAPVTPVLGQRQEPKKLRTIRISPKMQDRAPSVIAATAAPAPAPTHKAPARVAPETQDQPASQALAWAPLPPAKPAPGEASPWRQFAPPHSAARTLTVPAVSAPAASTPAVAAKPPVAKLDAETVALLIKRGKQFISDGDLASARVALRRASESGSAEAALALAGTYDPAELKRLGVEGLAPDTDKARFWYEKARQLGSQEAPRLLRQLAKGSN